MSTIIRRRSVPQPAVSGDISLAQAVGVTATGAAAHHWSLRSILRRTDWSVAYFAFLVYIFVVTSYRLPLGTASMATALLAMPVERKGFRFPPVAVWAIMLWTWALIGWPISEYRDIVGEQLLDFAKVCAVLLVALNVLTTRNRLRVFLILFLGTFALYPTRGALFAYFIYGGADFGRAAWNYIYSNPNDLAGFCLLAFSLSAGVAVTERKKWIRLAAMAGMGVLPFLIVLTGSRAGFIGLGAFVLLAFRKQLFRFKKLAAMAVVAVVTIVFVPDNVWHRIGTIRDVNDASARSEVEYESSTGQRIEIWKVASTIAAEHPVFGVGLGAYSMAHFQYAQRPQFDVTAYGHRDAHSTYLRVATELGLVGLSLFVAILVATFKNAERARRAARRSHPQLSQQLFYMEMGLVAYLVAGIWASWGTLVFTYVHLAVLNVAARLLSEDAAAAAAPARDGSAPARAPMRGRLMRRLPA